MQLHQEKSTITPQSYIQDTAIKQQMYPGSQKYSRPSSASFPLGGANTQDEDRKEGHPHNPHIPSLILPKPSSPLIFITSCFNEQTIQSRFIS